MDGLLNEIRKCTICVDHLPHKPNPILAAHHKSKIVIIGQAPGSVVNRTGIPWDDKSGDNLRQWLGVDKNTFYNQQKIALIPMGFCYPGTGKSGDLPPRKECAPHWHPQLLNQMRAVRLTILIGQYAQAYYLLKRKGGTLTETVKSFKSFLPDYFVLPHPSPRNNIWLSKNPWFAEQIIPRLQSYVAELLSE